MGTMDYMDPVLCNVTQTLSRKVNPRRLSQLSPSAVTRMLQKMTQCLSCTVSFARLNRKDSRFALSHQNHTVESFLMQLNTKQEIALLVLTMSSAWLSILGSSLVLSFCCRVQSTRGSYERILIGFSLSDIIMSLNLLYNSF